MKKIFTPVIASAWLCTCSFTHADDPKWLAHTAEQCGERLRVLALGSKDAEAFRICPPEKINTTVLPNGIQQQWVYDYAGGIYLYFEDHILMAKQF